MHQILMKTTAILLILSTYIISTTAYQFNCYSCTNCNDPFNATKSSLVLCSNGCYKNLNKIPGSYAVERGCSSSSDGCTNKIYGVLGYGVYNYCCWDNYCNFSMILKFNQYTTLIQAILYFFLSKVI